MRYDNIFGPPSNPIPHGVLRPFYAPLGATHYPINSRGLFERARVEGGSHRQLLCCRGYVSRWYMTCDPDLICAPRVVPIGSKKGIPTNLYNFVQTSWTANHKGWQMRSLKLSQWHDTGSDIAKKRVTGMWYHFSNNFTSFQWNIPDYQ